MDLELVQVILFRCRQWGSADWTYLSMHSESDDDEDTSLIIASVIGSALQTAESLHVQIRTGDGEWDELE